jgi:hypothetical protein
LGTFNNDRSYNRTVTVPLSVMSLFFFSSSLFLEQSPLIQNLLSKIPLLLPLLAFVIYRGRGEVATLSLSSHEDRVKWLGRSLCRRPSCPQGMVSLSNLYHGGKWGAWVVLGVGQVGRERGEQMLQRRGRKTFFPSLCVLIGGRWQTVPSKWHRLHFFFNRALKWCCFVQKHVVLFKKKRQRSAKLQIHP